MSTLRDAVAKGKLGWMCSTDFADELGHALGGDVVYPDKYDLLVHKPCITDADSHPCAAKRVIVFDADELEQALAILEHPSERHLTEHQKAVEEAAGMGLDWGMANAFEVGTCRPASHPGAAGSHTDDIHVDGFALCMKRKLEQKRGEGYGGWDNPQECKVEHLAHLFVEHIGKGDPIDLANFAMMLHYRIGGSEALKSEWEHISPSVRPVTGNASVSELRGALARGYCSDANRHKVLDGDLIEAMVKEILASSAAEQPQTSERPVTGNAPPRCPACGGEMPCDFCGTPDQASDRAELPPSAKEPRS